MKVKLLKYNLNGNETYFIGKEFTCLEDLYKYVFDIGINIIDNETTICSSINNIEGLIFEIHSATSVFSYINEQSKTIDIENAIKLQDEHLKIFKCTVRNCKIEQLLDIIYD